MYRGALILWGGRAGTDGRHQPLSHRDNLMLRQVRNHLDGDLFQFHRYQPNLSSVKPGRIGVSIQKGGQAFHLTGNTGRRSLDGSSCSVYSADLLDSGPYGQLRFLYGIAVPASVSVLCSGVRRIPASNLLSP